MYNSSFITLNQKSFCQKDFEIGAQGKKCQNGNLARNSHFAILALLSLCIDFKIFFGKMTFGWVLWKSYYTFLLKKCLRPCPGLSMYLSERINWIISSFPRWISKILFVLGSWDHFGSLGCRIGEGPFFYVSTLFLWSVSQKLLEQRTNTNWFLKTQYCVSIAMDLTWLGAKR